MLRTERVSRVQNARIVLIAGFGGLLLLVAFAGLDTNRVFCDVEARNGDRPGLVEEAAFTR